MRVRDGSSHFHTNTGAQAHTRTLCIAYFGKSTGMRSSATINARLHDDAVIYMLIYTLDFEECQ